MPFLVCRVVSCLLQTGEASTMSARCGRNGRCAAGIRIGLLLSLSLVQLITIALSPRCANSRESPAAKDDARGRPSIQIGWTATPPVIDGRLDPDEWRAAAFVDELTQAIPDEGQAPTQHSEIWIMTDEEHLFIAARLWDTNPEEIVASAMERDGNSRLDDRFGFSIDPFLDRQNGYFFQVNPNGIRRDFLIEGAGAEPSWDGRWYAKTSVDAEGWTVEIALPYATINFDPEGNVWGFNMARGIRRRDEIARWADPVRERFLLAMGNAGNLVGMRGIHQGLGLQVVPAGTLRRVDDVSDPVDSSDRRHYTRADPSLDVFYKLTPSLTTALTVNTDFGETEVDERRVNLSRFALFFPEKRDFFLQDALIFDFGELQKNGRPFFSRRIGLDGDGNPQGITAGGKVTGRIGRFKIGLLDVVLDEHDQVDQQNLLVARAAANFGESRIGAIVTRGDPEAMGDNTLVGADFVYRDTDFLDKKTLSGSTWFQASVNDPDTGPGADEDAVNGAGLAYGVALSYPNDRTDWQVAARVFESEYDPALGFANRVGVREFGGRYRRRFRPDDWAAVETIDSGVKGLILTNFDGTVETGEFTWTLAEITSPIDDLIRFQYAHRYEFVETPFDTLDVALGRYHFDELRLRLGASSNRRVSATIDVGHGGFFDGSRTRTRWDTAFRFTKHVQAGVLYGIDDIHLPEGDQVIHLLRARLSFFFTPDISWVTLVQFDNVSDSMGVNSRFRWIVEDGRELFLVLNQGFDTSDDLRAVRTAPLAKLQWTFRF
ncbi:MAG: hypothetical protein CL908_05515 [Deltaproteobacteria bacterium]|nr:hypothetical protein [Deltaproteobacteria bacterium]